VNIKTLARFGGQAIAAATTVRMFSKARREGDKLRMLDAIVTAVSIALTVAVVVRELRETAEGKSRLIELGDE
jgi:hypothetical protein